jgi:citrate lyase subunit beta/citryl-CoA lyase
MHPAGYDAEEAGLMRSLLFVPGDSERKLEKGFSAGADVVIVDLEDSVAAGNKETARKIAADFIRDNRARTSAAIYVRINDLSSGLTDDDLASLMPAKPDGVMLPKSNGLADVQQLSAKLRVHEAEAGLPDGRTKIIPIITETAAGLLAAGSYSASPRLSGLTWGAEDLSAAIGARATRDQSGRYTDVNFRDIDGLRAECLEAERDGFTGKMAIHPDQVPVINEAFTPSPEAVAHAQTVVEAFRAAGDPGVVGIDGQMYDRPHLRRAERLLARARAAGL